MATVFAIYCILTDRRFPAKGMHFFSQFMDWCAMLDSYFALVNTKNPAFILYSIQESDTNDARESNICTYKIASASNLQHSLKARHYQYVKSNRISRIKHLRSKRKTEWGVTVRARATSFARPTFVFTFSLIQKQNVLVHTMHLTVGHYWLRLHSFPFATNVTLQYSPSR